MSLNQAKLLLVPGEGVGPEIMVELRRVLDWLSFGCGLTFDLEEESDLAAVPDKARKADAVLIGALDGPALQQLHRELGLHIALRPVRVMEPLVYNAPLKPEYVRDLDLMLVQALSPDSAAKVARMALTLARQRKLKICVVDKSGPEAVSLAWRAEIERVRSKSFAEIAMTSWQSDLFARQLVRHPRQFDVILLDEVLGDVLSSVAGMITGVPGLLPAAAIGDEIDGHRIALFGPLHGPAPAVAGKGEANPIGAILSLALMLRQVMDRPAEAQHIETAVQNAVGSGIRTVDIVGHDCTQVTTHQMGNAILTRLAQLQTA